MLFVMFSRVQKLELTFSRKPTLPQRIATLSWSVGLSALETPRAMPAEASSPGRATQSPTKRDPPVLQVKGVGTGLTTLSRKTPMLRKRQKKKTKKKPPYVPHGIMGVSE